jgi:DNA repair protein RecO (recombination protein O)
MVLHRRSYRETSYMMDFFTLENGIVRAIAKGVRGARSDRRSLLQPLQPLKIQLTGKTELKTLKQVEANGSALRLQGHGVFCAMYLNELINRVIPAGVECEDLYHAYLHSLEQLADTSRVEVVLREFEFALLTELGVMPDWSLDVGSGTAIEPGLHYQFIAEQGFTSGQSSGRGFTYSGRDIIALGEQQWTNTSLRAAKQLCRHALHPFVGNKPLKSRELFITRKNLPSNGV